MTAAAAPPAEGDRVEIRVLAGTAAGTVRRVWGLNVTVLTDDGCTFVRLAVAVRVLAGGDPQA